MSVLVGEFCEMWAKLIVSVTLLPMLVHSIIGCCWHHAHVDCIFNCMHSTTEANSTQAAHKCHGHQHDHRSEQRGPVVPEPCEHGDSCNDVRCVYLVAESVRSTFAYVLNEDVPAFDGCCMMHVNPTSPLWQIPQRNMDVLLPSQRCALTQVWVV